MPEAIDENNFTVKVGNDTYKVTVSYEGVYISHYKIETNGEQIATIYMNEEGQWQSENDLSILDENLVEKIGRAIEEHDMR